MDDINESRYESFEDDNNDAGVDNAEESLILDDIEEEFFSERPARQNADTEVICLKTSLTRKSHGDKRVKFLMKNDDDQKMILMYRREYRWQPQSCSPRCMTPRASIFLESVP